MKPRNMFLATVVAAVILAVQFAWWAAQPVNPARPALRPALAVPVATQTGEVIPALNPGAAFASSGAEATLAATAATSPAHRPTLAQHVDSRPDQVPSRLSGPARESALVEANKVRHMITDYHTLMGENPVGTNAEIMMALMGGNPHQARLGPPEGQSLNDQGELVDQWGTPYFFHQLSRDRMEIYSAGPDKILGTADDIVVR